MALTELHLKYLVLMALSAKKVADPWFSGNIFLLLQDFVANAQISCFGKIFSQTQDFLKRQDFSCKCNIFLLECIAVSISQEILQKQDFLAKSRFSCKCKIFLPMQDFLATKCKGAKYAFFTKNKRIDF